MKLAFNAKQFRQNGRAIVDGKGLSAQAYASTFIRLEAGADQLRMVGPAQEADIPAQVQQAGVLFVPMADFARLIKMLLDSAAMELSADAESLHCGDVTFKVRPQSYYPDPTQAPKYHPTQDYPVVPCLHPNTPAELRGLFVGDIGIKVTQITYTLNPVTTVKAWQNPFEVMGTIWIDPEQTTGFIKVPRHLWELAINGQPPCEIWLRARLGRCLTRTDCKEFQDLLTTLHVACTKI